MSTLEILRAVTDQYRVSLDHACPPPPNACRRCTVLANASKEIERLELEIRAR